ncbi:hypothetical protein ACFFJB_07605 [Camelimonas abortus]|uniref:Uncharacterized protein n=1 Tax=Camelimonas abortus TaxID=1017184 RepID=A0ABV7LFQ3_9HYPH
MPTPHAESTDSAMTNIVIYYVFINISHKLFFVPGPDNYAVAAVNWKTTEAPTRATPGTSGKYAT